MAKGVCVLRGAFVDGVKVRVVERVADFPPTSLDTAGEVVTTVSAKDGEVKVDGLEVGVPYWALQEVDGAVRSRGFTAHDPSVYVSPAKRRAPTSTGQVPVGYADVSVEGARSSSAIPAAHEPQKDAEAAPFKGVADVRGAKLSDTPMGEGHVPAPEEEIPPLPTESAATLEEIAKPKKKSAPKKKAPSKARSAAAKKAAATRRRNAKKGKK